MNILKLLYTLLIIITLVSAPIASAETLGSTNYQVENPSVDVGGELSSSTNYTSRESIGGSNDSAAVSANYKVFPGFVQHAYPGVPGQPTLTNTGGTLYNALDFILATAGNQTDTTYAIAISSDDFATTNFVQADDTVSTSPVWQTYTSWGSGTGQRITGLTASTTYKIKVKARYGIDTETAYSITATAATSGASITVSFAGVNSGTSIAGETTTTTSTTNAIGYGTLAVGTPSVAAHSVTVTTNATGGYTTTIQQDHDLQTNTSNTIAGVSGTNTAPAAWPGSVTTGAFGYHTTDAALCTGTPSRFSANNTYAALTTNALEVACNTTSVTSETTTVVYKLQIGGQQQNGDYQNKVTLITTAQY